MYSTLAFDPPIPGPGSQSASSPGTAPRTRRQQVARACSNCRAFRIKCDNEQPCRNCKRKGRKCGQENSSEVRTFASAVREIDRLNKRVQELEALLQAEGAVETNSPPASRARSKATSFLPLNLDPRVEHGGNVHSWECVQLDSRAGTTQCYGPASIFYFIARMNQHLANVGTTVAPGYQVAPMADRMGLLSNTDFESDFEHMAGPINRIYMERAYEEFYLNVFWEEYHCIYPIIEEADFWNYHRSLWDRSQKFRKPSALIDIMLATCLQHGTKSMHADERPHALADKSDEMIASRWFYRRCQSLLTSQLETPSVMTLQSHVLCVIYLSNANCGNAAQSILAIAIRAGIILGLHLEPPENLPTQQREARKRLWWLLYALEMKFAMELGRPLAVNISQVTCSLPSDEAIAYTSVQRTTTLSKEAAYLSFSVHFVRLVLAARAIYVTFYDKCASVLDQKKQKSLYGMPHALEACAEYLESRMQYAQAWLHEVPKTLKTRRENGGVSFSNDHTRLYLDGTLPRWQQQQSIFLELCYQNTMMNLYRPFICFPPPSVTESPSTDRAAASCLAHALSVTAIIWQVHMESKLLDNHQEIFRWQWNATLSLIGYMIAYPNNAEVTKAERAVRTAIKIFERLGECFSIALLAEQTTEELLARVNTLSATGGLETLSALTRIQSPNPKIAVTTLGPPHQIDPGLVTDFAQFTSTAAGTVGMLGLMGDASDRFAWGESLVSDEYFGMGNSRNNSSNSSNGHGGIGKVSGGVSSSGSSSSLPWPASSMGEDDELLRLLNGIDYVADETNAMLDPGP